MSRRTYWSPLQILTGETFSSRTTNVRDEARLDISARDFWTKHQEAVFDVRVFDPNAKRYEGKSLQQCYRTTEMEKKRNYQMRKVFYKLKIEVSPISFFRLMVG